MNSPRWEERKLVIEGISGGAKALSGPEHVAIDLTNRCSSRCIACWTRSPLLGDSAPGPSWHRQELDREVLDRLIDDLGAMGTVNIQFSGGGDPMLYPGIAEVVQRVKSHGMYCAITTGLPHPAARILGDVVDAGVDELAVSLWASDGRSWAATHPGRKAGEFRQVTSAVAGIKAEKGDGPLLNLLNVVCSVNYRKVWPMYRYALKVGADSIYFTLVDTIDGRTDSLLLTDRQRRSVARACARIDRRNGRLPEGEKLVLDGFEEFRRRLVADSAAEGHYDLAEVTAMPCYIGWVFCRILADGVVAPCCRGVYMPMGNINEAPFPEIWFSDTYDAFRVRTVRRGKDEEVMEVIGCGRTCDNHIQNMDLHRMMESVADGWSGHLEQG